ncbi:MAG: RICIN domain-containing protein [Synergistaceae bacterium]
MKQKLQQIKKLFLIISIITITAIPLTKATEVQAANVIYDGYYQLAIVGTNLVADVNAERYENGNSIIAYPNKRSHNQVWRIVPTGRSEYTFKILASTTNKALDKSRNSGSGKVLLWDYHGGENQQWIFENVQGGYVIRNLESGTLLDVGSSYVNTGDRLKVARSDSSSGQVFRLIKVSRPNRPNSYRPPRRTRST